jgi:hypothetical protein
MKFNLTNSELLIYLSYGVTLMYIWYISQIKIHYIFPFLILLLIIVHQEKNKTETFTGNKLRINNIIKELYDEKYDYLETEEIVLFIETLKPIRIHNTPFFNTFLNDMNIYFRKLNMSSLLNVMNTFEALYFTIPMELTDFYTDRITSLKDLLFKYLVEEDKKIIEMQSYLPYDYIHDNFNYKI